MTRAKLIAILGAALCLLLSPKSAAADRLFGLREGGVIDELDPLTAASINSFGVPEPDDPGAGGSGGLAFDGKALWFISNTGRRLWSLNPNTGAVLDSYDTRGFGEGRWSLAALGGDLYFRLTSAILDAEGNPKTQIIRLDPISGAVTTVGYYPGATLMFGMAGAGNRLLVDSVEHIDGIQGRRILRINPSTGDITGSFVHPNFSSILDVSGIAVVDEQIYLSCKRSDGRSTLEVFTLGGTFVRSVEAPFTYSLGGDKVGAPLDSDGDGVPDRDDHCPNSDLRRRVDAGRVTNIDNQVDEHGCSIQDKINELRSVISRYGQWVSAIAHLANDLRREGRISNRESVELKLSAVFGFSR